MRSSSGGISASSSSSPPSSSPASSSIAPPLSPASPAPPAAAPPPPAPLSFSFSASVRSYSTQLGCSFRYRCRFFSMGDAKPDSFFPLTVSHRGTRLWPGERMRRTVGRRRVGWVVDKGVGEVGREWGEDEDGGWEWDGGEGGRVRLGVEAEGGREGWEGEKVGDVCMEERRVDAICCCLLD